MAMVAVGEGAVNGGRQRVDAAVLVLHRLQQGEVVGAVGQVGAHPRPQVGVLGGVVMVQLGLEQLPAGEDGGSPGRVVQVGGVAAGGAGQVGQVASERVVERQHHRQVEMAGRARGGRVVGGHGGLLAGCWLSVTAGSHEHLQVRSLHHFGSRRE
jgi:hypothetical protein